MAHGRLVAARTRTREGSPWVEEGSFPAAAFCREDHWIRNSVLRRRVASCSPEPREERRESISSTKMMLGARTLATAKRARTSFSDSPNWGSVSKVRYGV